MSDSVESFIPIKAPHPPIPFQHTQYPKLDLAAKTQPLKTTKIRVMMRECFMGILPFYHIF